MVLSLITNNLAMAEAGDAAGIDRMLIDVERLGKLERQSGRCLFLSDHTIEDVRRLKQVVRRAKIMVRVDPLHFHTREQVNRAIGYGADVILLPYFHAIEEAIEFVDIIAGRVSAALLVETPESVAILPVLCRLSGVAEIHIGLNDLGLALSRTFLFDVIADGTIDRICAILRASRIEFGFGGIASLSRNDLPVHPEWVLAEQVCQGATRAWLGRTFRDLPRSKLPQEVRRLRKAIEYWKLADAERREEVRAGLRQQIRSVSAKLEQTAQMGL